MIHFTHEEISAALAMANARQDGHERAGHDNRGAEGPLTREQERWRHHIGMTGEYLISRETGLPFRPTLHDYDEVDLGVVESRATALRYGRLPINPGDVERGKLRLPFVLIFIDMDAQCAEIIGWLCGWEAMEHNGRVWYGPPQNTWYVPPPYHSVKSLQDWIDCGHPLHWCPEKYR